MSFFDALFSGFLGQAALAGIGVAVITGLLGCFVVWRRLAYFGEATAHGALLGVALSLALSLPVTVGVMIAAVAMALALALREARGYSADTLIGVAAHGMLAAGLVALSLMPVLVPDVDAFLFGDIFAVSQQDLAVIWGGAALVSTALVLGWRTLVNATLNAELAAAEGGYPDRARLALTLGLAVAIAVAIKVVGVLLMTAMLVIPAAAARAFTRTPEAMAAGAVAIGTIAVAGGLWISWETDSPGGPTIALAAALAFLACTALAPLLRR